MSKQSASVAIAAIVLALGGVGAAREASLVDAVKAGDAAAVHALLRKSTAVDVPDATGTTPLQWAVHHTRLELVDALLRAGADAHAANRYGATPLLLAAENGDAAIIARLLKAGASPDTSFPGGETALMTASRSGSVEAVTVLVKAGAEVNATERSRGQTALMWAAHRGNAAAVRTLLEAGADLRVRTDAAEHGGARPAALDGQSTTHRAPTGFTALLFAARAGRVDAVRALLDGGANANDTLSDGQSALVVATANAHWEVADLLLDRGADPNHAGAGWNALHQLIRVRRMNVAFGTPGPIPTGNVDSIDVIRKMLARGVAVNARMSRQGMLDGQRNRLLRLGATAYFLAAKGSDVEVMRLLLAAKADPSIPNAEGTTPLMVAAGLKLWNPGEDPGTLPGQEAEALEAVKLAVESGNDVNAANDEGETALHGVAYGGVTPVAEFLIAQGARLDVKDVRGWTPLAIASGLTYTDFYKDQPAIAGVLRTAMRAAGLSTDGHVIPASVCYDCYARPGEKPKALEHWKKMEDEYAAGQHAWPAEPAVKR